MTIVGEEKQVTPLPMEIEAVIAGCLERRDRVSFEALTDLLLSADGDTLFSALLRLSGTSLGNLLNTPIELLKGYYSPPHNVRRLVYSIGNRYFPHKHPLLFTIGELITISVRQVMDIPYAGSVRTNRLRKYLSRFKVCLVGDRINTHEREGLNHAEKNKTETEGTPDREMQDQSGA